MIKVVNVISDTNIGGAGKCVLTFLKHYDKEKFDLTIVVPRGSLLIGEIESIGGKYIQADGISDKSLSRAGIDNLKKIFKKIKPHIVHSHGCMSARIAARLCCDCKIIYTRHSVFEPSPKISKGIGKIINGFINNITADKIIAVANAAKDNLTDTGVLEKKIIVIPNGVKPLEEISDEQKKILRANYNVSDDEFVIGIVARLNEVKGHIYILEALKKLRDDGFKVKLLIAGTGDYEQAIRDRAKQLDVVHHVIMAGFITDVTGIMNILDANINASFGTEATSLSLLEGMSIGLPAIVSDFGGNPGVVTHGENGLIFETKNSDDLYEKVKMYLSDEALRESFRQKSKKIFDEKFTALKNTKDIENVYFSVLEGTR